MTINQGTTAGLEYLGNQHANDIRNTGFQIQKTFQTRLIYNFMAEC
jgi:hypothetical protein